MAGIEARVEEFLKVWRERNEEEKKTRKCLICDREFSSFQNHICPECHEKHKKLFESAPVGNWGDLIYDIDPPSEEAPQNVQEASTQGQIGGILKGEG